MANFEEFRRDLNQKSKHSRSSLIEATIIEPGGSNGSQQNGNIPYDTSGYPFRLSKFDEDEEFDVNNNMSDDSDRTLCSTDFNEKRVAKPKFKPKPQVNGPFQSYNESGRAFNLLELERFRNPILQTPNNNESALGRPSIMDDYVPRRLVSQLQSDTFSPNPIGSSYESSRSRRFLDLNKEEPWRFEFQQMLMGDPNSSRRFSTLRPLNERTRCPTSRPVSQQLPSKSLHHSQGQFITFLQNGDHQQIFSGRPTQKSPLFNTYVKDNYYPGIIEDAVNGQIDFNKVAFDAVFDFEGIPVELEPEKVPMSLLEAFNLRLQYERELLENIGGRTNQRRAEPKNEDIHIPEDARPPFWTHRDDLKLANAVDIDLSANQHNQPPTDLTKAITCLFKAEKMNNFDRNVGLAEEAIRLASPDHQEKAALRSTCSFKVDLQKDETKSNRTYKPIEVISYIGTTKPAEWIE